MSVQNHVSIDKCIKVYTPEKRFQINESSYNTSICLNPWVRLAQRTTSFITDNSTSLLVLQKRLRLFLW